MLGRRVLEKICRAPPTLCCSEEAACVCVCVCVVDRSVRPICGSSLSLSLTPSADVSLSLYGVLLHCKHHGAHAPLHAPLQSATPTNTDRVDTHFSYSLLAPSVPLSSPPMDLYSSYSQHRYVQPTLFSTLLLHCHLPPRPMTSSHIHPSSRCSKTCRYAVSFFLVSVSSPPPLLSTSVPSPSPSFSLSLSLRLLPLSLAHET